MALYLEPLSGGRQVVLDKAVILIGRQSDCDVVLDNSRKVSRKHCAIAQVNDHYVVRDLESMNGVSVNGARIQREAPLTVGDEVAFGDVRYILRETAAAKAARPAAPRAAQPPPPPPEPKRTAVPPRPVDISQKFPVPIADEGVEFAVEASMQFQNPRRLSADDRLEPILDPRSDSEKSAPADDDEQLPDVILLDDSDELDKPR